jgi:hypothetical protein
MPELAVAEARASNRNLELQQIIMQKRRDPSQLGTSPRQSPSRRAAPRNRREAKVF